MGEIEAPTKADAQGSILHSQMARTVVHKLGTDLRFRLAFLLVGVAIAVPVGLVTGKLANATIVTSVFIILSGLAGYREERLSKSLASTGRGDSDSN
jgi:hypothetical protein